MHCTTCSGWGVTYEDGEIVLGVLGEETRGFLPAGSILIGRPSTVAGMWHAVRVADRCPACTPPSQRVTPVSSYPPITDLEASAVAICREAGTHGVVRDAAGVCINCHCFAFED